MRKILFDSSVWISFFLEKDVHHEKAVKLIFNLTNKNNYETEILIPEIILAEILNTLSKFESVDFANHVYNQFLELQQIRIVFGEKNFWLEYFPQIAGKENLKTADAIILAYANFLMVDEFVSFDKKLSKAFLGEV
jgi:predicted nucleic acid-binding protein